LSETVSYNRPQIGVTALTGLSLLSIKTNAMTVETINVYPNYVYFYAFQFVCPSVICLVISAFSYARHRPLRTTVARELRGLAEDRMIRCV
jgi:hypothetical protein